MSSKKESPRAEATADAGGIKNHPQRTPPIPGSQEPIAVSRIPTELRAPAKRILDRVRRCAPATRASWRLFAQRIAEQTIGDPHAGPDDADAARSLLDLIHADPASVDRLLAEGDQLALFVEGGER